MIHIHRCVSIYICKRKHRNTYNVNIYSYITVFIHHSVCCNHTPKQINSQYMGPNPHNDNTLIVLSNVLISDSTHCMRGRVYILNAFIVRWAGPPLSIYICGSVGCGYSGVLNLSLYIYVESQYLCIIIPFKACFACAKTCHWNPRCCWTHSFSDLLRALVSEHRLSWRAIRR